MPRPNFKRPRNLIILALIALDIFLLARGLATPLATLLTIGLPLFGLFQLGRNLLRRSHVIWRLRNRLLVTYAFVGAVPILLILALAFSGAWIVVGQVATYLVHSELKRMALSLENPARFLSAAQAGERDAVARQITPLLQMRYPAFEIFMNDDPRFPTLPGAWKNYTGILEKDNAWYIMALVRTGENRAAVIAPLTEAVQAKVVPGIGAVNFNGSEKFAGDVPAAWGLLDFECLWGNPVEYVSWTQPNVRNTFPLAVITRPSAVLGVVFADRVDFAQGILILFLTIAGSLAFVEIVSVIVSITMTRTVTGAVHHLYEGTLKIGAGDFSHRIPVRGDDQLAELGASFNQMTEQLGHLVVVAKEKERLQSELAIASEVQNQLFPRKPPPMATIRLLGACEPARSVSGDYYDYLCLPDGNLAIAIGDVAGKGISAALLMAAIQSIMRTQLASGAPSPARIVGQLNKQLFENTSSEKYATFFFGAYDETSRALTYTNAGHLPPLLLSGEKVTQLDPTGTVVGIFPKIVYSECSVNISADDLLIAYTDGITEPENAYGEEFGSERLTETVLRNRACEPEEIVAKVMEAVKHWSHSAELPDDMTVVVARGLA